MTNYNSFGVRKTERIKAKGDDWVFRSFFLYIKTNCQYQCKLLMVEKKSTQGSIFVPFSQADF